MLLHYTRQETDSENGGTQTCASTGKHG